MTAPKPVAPKRYRNLQSLQGVSRNALHSFYRKGLDAAGVLPDEPFPKRLPALLPQHWWPWVSSYVQHVFQPKHAFPGYDLAAGGSPGVYPLSSDPQNRADDTHPIRVSLAGDWATGTIESYWVAEQMRAFAPHYTIHLGDVYYVGDPAEVDENCLGKAPGNVAGVVWPSGSIGSFALNGNHEMYANGNAYFERFLPRLGMLDPRTSRPDGQLASFFCLVNQHWAVIGVDTGYNSRGFPILGQVPFLRDLAGIRPTCRLEDRLLEWFRAVVAPLLAGRGVVLLSHHQYYSGFDAGYERPARQLAAYVTGPVLWFWGHEHRLAIYGEHQATGGFPAHGRCLGHGGMPVARGTPDPRKGPTPLLWDNRVYRHYGSGEAVGFNGYADLTFAGDTLTVEYQSLARTSGGDYSGRHLLATERWRMADGTLRLLELRQVDPELDGAR